MNKKEIAEYAKRAERRVKDELLTQFCAGKRVLDVGCIGQDRDFEAPNWLHNKIKKYASSVDGVDILTEEIARLNKMGYSMLTIDQLKASQQKYEVVLMSDVIEHVNDPVEFLKFYSGFLMKGGTMFISTPNSNRSNNFVNILFNNNYAVNPEHVFWFCPKTFAEVVSRAGLTIREFFWADHYYTSDQVKGSYQKFKHSLINFLRARRSNFNPNMIFLVTAD